MSVRCFHKLKCSVLQLGKSFAKSPLFNKPVFHMDTVKIIPRCTCMQSNANKAPFLRIADREGCPATPVDTFNDANGLTAVFSGYQWWASINDRLGKIIDLTSKIIGIRIDTFELGYILLLKSTEQSFLSTDGP